MRTLLLILPLVVPVLGNEAPTDAPPPAVHSPLREGTPGARLWKLSMAAVAGANALDIHSSWGKRELNRPLAGRDGTFGAKGAAIKLAIHGGALGVQYLILRRRPNRSMYRILSILNFGSASITGGVALRNYTIPRPVP